jgi:hypothetical protein
MQVFMCQLILCRLQCLLRNAMLEQEHVVDVLNTRYEVSATLHQHAYWCCLFYLTSFLQVPAELVAEAEQQAKAAAEESDMED